MNELSGIDDSYDIIYGEKEIGIAAIFLMKTKIKTGGKSDEEKEEITRHEEIDKALEEDFEDYVELFKDMHFKVKEFSGEMNFSTVGENLEKVLEEIKPVEASEEMEKEETNHSCFICMFIGHGRAGFIKTTDGKLNIQDDILDKFMSHKCLERKPKLFIFQACRGAKENKVSKSSQYAALCDGETKPDGSNTLICYAALNGCVSYAVSSDGHGTQYLQDLHKALRMYTKPNNPRNVIDILTVVNKKVSNTLLPESLVEAGDSQRKRVKTFDPKETSTPPTTGFAGKSKSEKVYHYYQVPSFESSLIKKLFLKIPVNKLVQPPAPQPASADADAQ